MNPQLAMTPYQYPFVQHAMPQLQFQQRGPIHVDAHGVWIRPAGDASAPLALSTMQAVFLGLVLGAGIGWFLSERGRDR